MTVHVSFMRSVLTFKLMNLEVSIRSTRHSVDVENSNDPYQPLHDAFTVILINASVWIWKAIKLGGMRKVGLVAVL